MTSAAACHALEAMAEAFAEKHGVPRARVAEVLTLRLTGAREVS
jgi:hypothetical protein